MYRRRKLYYVGLASNLRGRLKDHLKDKHAGAWDRFSVYLTVSDGHMRELESLLLRIVEPSGNAQLGKFAKSENLARRFGRDVKAAQQRDYDRLMGRTLRRTVKVVPGSRKNDAKPPLTGCFRRATMLWGVCKGTDYTARVRKDGTIRFDRIETRYAIDRPHGFSRPERCRSPREQPSHQPTGSHASPGGLLSAGRFVAHPRPAGYRYTSTADRATCRQKITSRNLSP